MKEKIFVLFISMLFLISIIPVTISEINSEQNETIYVDDDNTIGPWDGSQQHPYQFVQEGLNHANDGDTVFVKNGFYSETNLTCNVSITLKGEDNEQCIIDGSSSNDYGTNFYVNAVNVYITNLTFKNYIIALTDIEINESILPDDYVILDNNILEDTICGFLVGYNSENINVEITNNIIRAKGNVESLGNILFSLSKSLIVSNNIIEGFLAGIICLGKAEIIQNQIMNNYYGVMVDGDNQQIINNNFIENTVHANFFYDINLIKFNKTMAGNPNLLHYINLFSKNLGSKDVYPTIEWFGKWNNNYWDNKKGIGPKFIIGFISFGFIFIEEGYYKYNIKIPWINFDWHPAKEPFDITIE
jgi:hypothetical protein